jgi:glycosyltransferase involved in cell wall biosynthesis
MSLKRFVGREVRMAFSIVIPLFNKRETIGRAINSALNQTIAPIEVIVVDDGSTDGSADVVAQFGGRVQLIRQANAGPAAARNNGASRCAGDHLVFLDGDDQLIHSALEEHLACLTSRGDVDISLASFRKIDAGGSNSDVLLTHRVNDTGARFFYLTEFSTASVIQVASTAICVSRALFKKVSGFDEALRCWEITDFLMRASLVARVIGLHGEVSAIVHELADNSQFLRTREVPEYRLHFACKIAAHLDHMSHPARAEMADQALNFAASLWCDGYLREFKLVCSRLVRLLDQEQRQNRLIRLSRLPESALMLLYLMRKTIPQPGKLQRSVWRAKSN